MKVLYLTPPNIDSHRLTRYTFVDEEIQGLAKRGVQLYLPVSKLLDNESENIHTRLLPAGKSLEDLLHIIPFLMPLKKLLPICYWLQPMELIRTIRIEGFCVDLIRNEQIDLIHSQFGWPGGFGGVLAKQATAKPLVATFRGMDILLDSRIDYGLRQLQQYDKALRILLQYADHTTYFSKYMRQKALQLGAAEETARTTLKGVDCTHFNGIEPIQHGFGDRPIILVVGGLIKRKGVDNILRALSYLADTYDFHCVVIGEGSELDHLKALCGQLSLLSCVTFVGVVARDLISRWFAACDIFVHSAIWEAAGNVLLEAMASGKPVICTDAGGPQEYVTDGKTGFVVPVGKPIKMAEKIRLLLDNPELRKEMGAQGRQRTLIDFPYSRMIDDICDVYQRIMTKSQTNSEMT